MLPPPADRAKLTTALDGLTSAVEELLLSGLTTASESTRQTLTAAMQEASRSRLLRLGSALRASAEELGRFTRGDAAFSRRRLSFFLGRSWLLSRGLSHALHAGDEAGFDRLAWTSASAPLPAVEVVCLGVAKRVAAGSFAAFEFRLRAVADAGPVLAGSRLTWSVIFPIKPGLDIAPEAFLSLSQKQKFTPISLLDRTSFVIRDAAVATDESGGGRVALNDGSTVVAGGRFEDWTRFLDWTPRPAIERLGRHRPGPLDLENELQEEVVLRDYEVGAPTPGDEPGHLAYPIAAGPLELQGVVGPGPEDAVLRKGLDALRTRKKDRPPLFGLMHYERCRLVFQPLTTFGDDGPDHLTVSKEGLNKIALLKAMSFT